MSSAKSARTANQVIQGALRALCLNGVQATTTRKIAAEAKVPLATLHYHFESKSALLMAVLKHLIDETTAALRIEAKRSADLASCVEQLLRRAWLFLIRTRDLQLVQYELTFYALREGAQWLAERQYDAYVNLYRDLLFDVAKQTGALNASDCAALARFILAGIDGLLIQELAKPNRSRSAKGLEVLIRAGQSYALLLQKECRERNHRRQKKATMELDVLPGSGQAALSV
jgi:AcrR family transcriptional regulator